MVEEHYHGKPTTLPSLSWRKSSLPSNSLLLTCYTLINVRSLGKLCWRAYVPLSCQGLCSHGRLVISCWLLLELDITCQSKSKTQQDRARSSKEAEPKPLHTLEKHHMPCNSWIRKPTANPPMPAATHGLNSRCGTAKFTLLHWRDTITKIASSYQIVSWPRGGAAGEEDAGYPYTAP